VTAPLQDNSGPSVFAYSTFNYTWAINFDGNPTGNYYMK
jgi:hypothetical protein